VSIPYTFPRVLFTSRSSSGAWQIRGKQVAQTQSDWAAINDPTLDEISAADIVCVVKRTSRALIEQCRANGKLLVLDVVDFWPQPRNSSISLSAAESRQQVLDGIKKIQPDALIFPNRAMWVDFHKFFTLMPTTYIYHHFRPEFEGTYNRESNSSPVVAYEGGDYLGEWHETFQNAAKKLGATFLVNPASLLDASVVLNARSKLFQTYLNRNYKSNVKSVNAIGALKPFVCHESERSAHEIDPGCFLFFSDEKSLLSQLEKALYNLPFREQNLAQMSRIRPRFAIETIATEYLLFFEYVIGWYRDYPRQSPR